MATRDDLDTTPKHNQSQSLRQQLREMVDFFELRAKNDLELNYDENSLAEHQSKDNQSK